MDIRTIGSQFQNLGKDPGGWPMLPKVTMMTVLFGAIIGLGWYFYWNNQLDELDAAKAKEEQLKESYKSKLQQAINLEELRRQKEQVGQYVAALEKQLPSKAEMDALLSDINQSGVGRGLAFELFRPSAPVLKEYYAEIPISIKVSGSFHDIAYFSSDLAALPRIVTLNALNVSVPITQGQQSNNNQLILEAVAKTFRYLDQDEIATQRKTTTAQPNGTSGGAKP